MRLGFTNSSPPKINELHVQLTPSDAARLRTALQPYKIRSRAVGTAVARIEAQLLSGPETVDLVLSTWAAAQIIEDIDELDDRFVGDALMKFRTALLQAFASWASAR